MKKQLRLSIFDGDQISKVDVMNDLITRLVRPAERETDHAYEDNTSAALPPRLLELAKNSEALDPSQKRNVLLSGFTTYGGRKVSRPFLEESWNLYLASSKQELERAASTFEFGLILVDVDHINEYGPLVVHSLRRQEVAKDRAHIIAVAEFFMPGFADQLFTAGVDELLSLPTKSQSLALNN